MWKETIQKLFKHHTLPVSEQLWERLEAQLPSQKQPTRKLFYYIVAANLLLLLGITLFWKANMQEKGLIVHKIPIKVKKDTFTLLNQPISSKKEIKQIAKVSQTTKKALDIPQKETKNIDAEVDNLLSNISSEEIIAQVLESIRKEAHNTSDENEYLLADLDNVSVEELLLMASSQAQVAQYVEDTYNTDKTLLDIEKEHIRERLQNILDDFSYKYHQIKLALKL